MKKWLIGIGLVLVIAIVCIYIYIPPQLEISAVRLVQCTPQAAFRKISKADGWTAWWPGGVAGAVGGGGHRYKNDVYKLSGQMYPVAEISIIHDDEVVVSKMNILSLTNRDSSVINWECRLDGGSSPFSRLRQYFSALRIKKGMTGILSVLRPFLENEKNLYGLSVGEASTKDTLLVVTKAFFPQYPGTPEIYQLLGKLRRYAAKEGATEKGFPIANVTYKRDSGYQLMTAVSIDKVLPDAGDILFRRMVPAKFLVAEVKGGDATVRAAMDHLNDYIADHQRTVMAIPYQTLVTDRMKEPDSTRWTTWLYCPVF